MEINYFFSLLSRKFWIICKILTCLSQTLVIKTCFLTSWITNNRENLFSTWSFHLKAVVISYKWRKWGWWNSVRNAYILFCPIIRKSMHSLHQNLFSPTATPCAKLQRHISSLFSSQAVLYALLVPTELTISNICTSLMLILTSVGLFARALFAGIGLKPLW